MIILLLFGIGRYGRYLFAAVALIDMGPSGKEGSRRRIPIGMRKKIKNKKSWGSEDLEEDYR